MLRISAHVIAAVWREEEEDDGDYEGNEVFRLSDYMKYVRGFHFVLFDIFFVLIYKFIEFMLLDIKVLRLKLFVALSINHYI